MYIAIVDFPLRPDARDAALALLARDAGAARAMEGNAGYRVLTDAAAPDLVTLFHGWESRAAFEAYAASPLFAGIAEAIRPLMSGAPVSQRMEVQPDETVRG